MSDMPWERMVLLVLAAFRAEITFAAGLVSFLAFRRAVRTWLAIVFAMTAALGASVVSADGIEHWVRATIGRSFGHGYNPFVSAVGEWEGWNGSPGGYPDARAAWEKAKCGPSPFIWWGDTGSFCTSPP